VSVLKITILTENMTRIDAYYLGEPGVSYLIECDGNKYLFDTGYSDVFARNARKMGTRLNEIDAIILSHGHNDHTGGMKELPEELMEMSARVEKTVDYLKKQSPKLLCPSHCTCFQAREAINKSIHITEVCVGDIFEVE